MPLTAKRATPCPAGGGDPGENLQLLLENATGGRPAISKNLNNRKKGCFLGSFK
jgi:hypothetical protein